MQEIITFISFIGQGLGITLLLLGGGFAIGLTLGLLIALLSYHKKLTLIIKCYVALLRSTPLILQLSFIYFVLPSLLPLNIGVVTAGILAFGLNSSAYVGEIFKAGILSVPNGQFLAAKSLQIPNFYLWKDIIMPQVIKNIAPALVNEAVTLAKDTAMIAILGGMDLMRRTQIIAAEHFTYFIPLCVTAFYYSILVYAIEQGSKHIFKSKRKSYVKSL
ncbi:MAG: glutamine ABC transporter permease [Legionellales bacterium RIFCSPHIGHO2_12_FULL_37_14]|nr:MAG: glutamine ABC transporter permease [Legionellales bacterium RIFCSPHIGHO2_12_FULL_37_14]